MILTISQIQIQKARGCQSLIAALAHAQPYDILAEMKPTDTVPGDPKDVFSHYRNPQSRIFVHFHNRYKEAAVRKLMEYGIEEYHINTDYSRPDIGLFALNNVTAATIVQLLGCKEVRSVRDDGVVSKGIDLK